jgi:hypothetical protein
VLPVGSGGLMPGGRLCYGMRSHVPGSIRCSVRGALAVETPAVPIGIITSIAHKYNARPCVPPTPPDRQASPGVCNAAVA